MTHSLFIEVDKPKKFTHWSTKAMLGYLSYNLNGLIAIL